MLRKKNVRAQEEESKDGSGEVARPMTTTPAELRLNKDFADLELQPNIHLSFPNESSRMKFDVVFDLTREECLWKGGKYKFNFEVPYNYPIEPPKAHCETPIYHPNIDTAGNVCLNILRADWKPVLNVYSVIAGCQ